MTNASMLPRSMCNLINHVSNELHKAQRPKLAEMYRECFSNTYQTTIQRLEDGSTFVITGDIPAMWLRDSSAQVRTYLLLANEDSKFAEMMKVSFNGKLGILGLTLMPMHSIKNRLAQGVSRT